MLTDEYFVDVPEETVPVVAVEEEHPAVPEGEPVVKTNEPRGIRSLLEGLNEVVMRRVVRHVPGGSKDARSLHAGRE